jgi:bifunctional DNase/RNase
MMEMAIDSIRVSLMNYQRVVILKQKDGDRYLPIWIGPHEADAIAVKLQDVSVSRPMTHDLLEKIIAAMGGSLKHIVVTDLQNDTFYAKISLDANGGSLEVDSRPSDAIALAVRSNVPIYVEETVLEKAGIELDKETEKSLGEVGGGDDRPAQVGKAVEEEEIRRMSAFKDFIEGLNLDDLEKGSTS